MRGEGGERMSGLHVSLLGPFRAELGGRALDTFRTSKAQALLIYLLVETVDRPGQGVGREQVMALLWPEMPRKSAQVNLRQTLYQLRKLIPEVAGSAGGPAPLVRSDRRRIWLNPKATYRLDVAAFTSLVEAEEPERLAEAVDLYRGDFLADFYLEDSNKFEEWAAGWRSRLRRGVLSALDRLAETDLASGEPDKAATYARRQLEIDNLRESAHRQLMAALRQMGKRAAALKQYDRCRALLRDELGVAPSAETEAVAAAIRRGDRFSKRQERLPVPETPLVGRETELADIQGLLLDGARLVSIVGPGGSGKTRLALEVAHRLVPGEEGGGSEYARPFERVCFVNLAPLSEAQEVAPTVARVLEPTFPESDRETLRRRLLDYLQGKSLLLVLDNFEHLLEEATLLNEILQAAPTVKLLVTSRERLKLQAEQVYPLSGLAYSRWATPVEAARDPAVQLFLQQAQRVRPAFRLHSDHLQPLHEIMALTEGMPLALILAAGWVTVLGTAEIAAELAQSLDFLQATHRDVPERQQSMRAVFGATWERLGEAEQAIFAALSVFRGGFTLEAAEAVAGATAGDLMRLSDRSLVTRTEGGRFEVHELLRQFAAERLEQRDEGQEARYAHSAYYCEFLQQREDDLKGPRVDEATAEITADLDNVRAAWTWAADNRQDTLLRQAAAAFAIFAHRRHLLREIPERFLQASEALAETEGVSPRTRATLLFWPALLTSFYPNRAALRHSEQQARLALSLLDEAAEAGEDVREERARTHMALGSATRRDRERAQHHLQTSLALFSELELHWEMAFVNERLSAKNLGLADYRRVRQHYGEAQRLFARAGHRPFSLRMRVAGARLDAFTGRPGDAEAALREGVAAFEDSGDRPYLALAQTWLGEAAIYCGRFHEALSELAVVQEMEITSNPHLKLHNRVLSNWVTLHLGRYQEAQEEATVGDAAVREDEHPYGSGLTSLVLGSAALALAKREEARRHMSESIRVFRAIDQRDELGWARAGLAYVVLHDGDVGAARRYLVKALRYAPEYHHYGCALMALPAVALLFAQLGEKERAVELYSLANEHGFVANSRWFEDIVGRRLAAVAESLPAEVAAGARARGAEKDLWETAGAILAELKRMESTM